MSKFPNYLQNNLIEYRKTLGVIQEFLSPHQLAILEETLQRLKNLNINIAVFGEVNSGKGSLLNTLLGCNNNDLSTCFFKLDDRPSSWSDEAELSNGKVWSNHGDLSVKIYDTPGIAGDIENYLDISMKITEKADIILYIVHEPVKSKLQVPYMEKIIDSGKPLIVVINKIDVLRPSQIAAIRKDLLEKFNLCTEQIIECAGYPIQGSPKIDNLVYKIIEIVNKHQDDLIDATLTTHLNVGVKEAQQILIQRAESEQKLLGKKKKDEMKKCNNEKQNRMAINHFIIHGSATVAAGCAKIFTQVPGVEEGSLTVITVGMTAALCANYNQLSKAQIFTYLTVVSGYILRTMAASYLYRWIPFLGNVFNSAVTFSLYETQGWIIVSFLEKGLYSEADVKQFSIETLKSEAERMKSEAISIVGHMDSNKIEELKSRVSEIESQTEIITE